MAEKGESLWLKVFLIALGAALGIFADEIKATMLGRTKYLEYQTIVQPGILNPPSINGGTVDVFLNGEPIDDLSEVEVSVYNHSDKDFENVPIYFDLRDPAGEPLVLVATDVRGEEFLPEAVDTLPLTRTPEDSSRIRLAFNIKTLNRSEGQSPSFRARFLFHGAVEPVARVRVSKAGVELRSGNGRVRKSHSVWFFWNNVKYVVIGIVSTLVVMAGGWYYCRHRMPDNHDRAPGPI